MSAPAPLHGVELVIEGEGRAAALARAWSVALGATPGRGAGPGATLLGGAAPLGGPGEDLPGLPAGTVAVAGAGATLGAALAGWRSGRHLVADLDAVAAQVVLPLVVAAETGTEAAAAPSRPLRLAGGEAVCADLGGGDDAEAFARLVEVVGPEVGAEELTARAQEWRLPVTPYRRRPRPSAGPAAWPGLGWCTRPPGTAPAPPPTPAPERGPRPADGLPPLADVTVADLTIMWSGPLATRLLASLGARVVKVEPECRPDGLRRSPGGHLFRALDEGKEHATLDLRRDGERAAFEQLVGQADLVVDNLSPRAARNLGLTLAGLAAANPATLSLGLPAFGEGAERDWVAYGTGAHAALGLGDTAHGPWAPVVTYPDPLTGFAAFAAALALLVAREVGNVGAARAEVPLASAIAPLLAVPCPPADPRLCPAGDLGARLAAAHRAPVRQQAPAGRREVGVG